MKERSHSFRLDFDATNKIIGLIVEGEVTDQFLFDGYVALQEGLAQCGPCVCIVDYTGATNITISTPGIRQLSNTKPIFPMDCLTLNIAPQNVMYGLARMFQILSSESRPNFQVVRTMDGGAGSDRCEVAELLPNKARLETSRLKQATVLLRKGAA